MKPTQMVFWAFLFASLFHGAAPAAINDLAVYYPAKDTQITAAAQRDLAEHILAEVETSSKATFSGYDQSIQTALEAWISSRMNDGKPDVLIIAAAAPSIFYQGQVDGSLAEAWMESGNMLLWTGSEPFSRYVDAYAVLSETTENMMGASNVLDVSTPGMALGEGYQSLSSAAADYGIAHLPEYQAERALRYDQLLIDATSSDWNHMSYWRVAEIFSEDSEARTSDNIVLVNDDGGIFAQFLTVQGEIDGADGLLDSNHYRMRTLVQFLNNWVAPPRNVLFVPDDHPSIQAAIDAAQSGDTVIVKAGTYFENLKMKKGVKVVSDAGEDGNELVDGPGYAGEAFGAESKKALKRALRTIIDGAGLPGGMQAEAMVDFPRGATVAATLDGFTVRNMPDVDHTIPGHAHVLQFRGASGAVINCLVHDNGSSGMGSHAWFFDQQTPMPGRDFRFENIEFDSHPIIVNNIVYRNKGNNLGNNHYAHAIMFNNEVFESISVEGRSAPGIGNQHGAAALIVKNLVYNNAWSGIGAEKGAEQGAFSINRPTRPTIRGNRVFNSGQNPGPGISGAGVSSDNAGGFDPKTGEIVYLAIEDNVVSGSVNAAIGARSTEPELGYVKITGNEASNGGSGGMGAGIELKGAIALEVSRNTVHGNAGAGIDISEGGAAEVVEENIVYENGTSGISVRDESSEAGSVRKNRIQDNLSAGISLEGPVSEVRNNIVIRNGGAGILCGDAPTAIVNNLLAQNEKAGVEDPSGLASIVNNIFYFNLNAGVRGESSDYSHNDLYGNNETRCESEKPWCQRPQYAGNDGGAGDVYADPLFMNPESQDFTLEQTSPCINQGDPDILDNDGTRSDIGPFGGPDPMSIPDDAQTQLDPKNENQPPKANAGADQSVNEGELVRLDGTGSWDVDGSISSYQWIQLSGPATALSDFTMASPSFTAPTAEEATVFEFELTVIDDGDLSDSDRVAVTMEPGGTEPPGEVYPEPDIQEEQTLAPDAEAEIEGELEAANEREEYEKKPTIETSSSPASGGCFISSITR